MSMKNVVFAAVLAALCAALPAPASAQLGFIKKQLKQKIVHTVVDSALNRVAGAPADSTPTAAPVMPAAPAQPAESTAATPAASSRIGGFLKKRLGQKVLHAPADSGRSRAAEPAAHSATAPGRGSSAARAATAPQKAADADPLVVQITPQALDGLEKFIAQQKAQRDRPEQPAGYALGMAAGGDPPATVRFSMMTQRVVAFCAATTDPQTAALLSMYGNPNDVNKSFEPSEIAALRPRCAKLMALLRSDS